MTPALFPEANASFGPPAGFDESQVTTIPAWRGVATSGSMDGVELVVVAWKPNEQELKELLAGGAIYLSFVGGLPPHFPCVSFAEASAPS